MQCPKATRIQQGNPRAWPTLVRTQQQVHEVSFFLFCSVKPRDTKLATCICPREQSKCPLCRMGFPRIDSAVNLCHLCQDSKEPPEEHILTMPYFSSYRIRLHQFTFRTMPSPLNWQRRLLKVSRFTWFTSLGYNRSNR